MAIGSAQQKGGTVFVFNEKGVQLWSKGGDLKGYTGSSVSIQKGSTVFTFNEKGQQTSAKSA